MTASERYLLALARVLDRCAASGAREIRAMLRILQRDVPRGAAELERTR